MSALWGSPARTHRVALGKAAKASAVVNVELMVSILLYFSKVCSANLQVRFFCHDFAKIMRY